ncbi:hypothetical protein ATANTOWER_028880 [Ataeniobius toweri]|uniref:Secreted protein n=1 Tax=Ataeniobius toweri TaxID=208326 RepID=A0ABU7B2M0_9TELE|nr:hypothetical protein [Ataeniobius toweri]
MSGRRHPIILCAVLTTRDTSFLSCAVPTPHCPAETQDAFHRGPADICKRLRREKSPFYFLRKKSCCCTFFNRWEVFPVQERSEEMWMLLNFMLSTAPPPPTVYIEKSMFSPPGPPVIH